MEGVSPAHGNDGTGDLSEQLLGLAQDGDPQAREDLWRLVYYQLRDLARRRLRGERAKAHLDTTALVHEAWPRLQRALENCNDVHHLMCIAAQAMRQIIVDHVRFHRRGCRCPTGKRVSLDELTDLFEARSGGDVQALDEALRDLQESDPDAAQLITLYFFGGYTIDEIAQARGVPRSTMGVRVDLARQMLAKKLSP